MRIRTQLTLAIFLTGSLGLAALVADRAVAAREMLYGRAQERADALLETVENLARPHLRSGDFLSINREIEALGRLPRVAYIQVFSRDGKTVLHAGRKASAGPQPELIELHSTTMDPDSKNILGGVQVAISTESLKESLQGLIWRGVALGALALLALAIAAWYIGIRLGRKLESLAEAVERVDMDKPLGIKDGGSDSEFDRLLRRFNLLHERLLRETAERRKLEHFKNDLTAMLIHDMKHPITVLAAVFSVLSDGEDDELGKEKKAGLLGMAKRNIRRENSMIEDVLQLARLNNAQMPLSKKRLSLNSFMEECAAENALIAEHSRRPWSLEVDEAIRSRSIFGDAVLLRRVVGNLVLNAVDHSPQGTGITLGARLCAKDRSKAEIFVRDEGPGVPAEQRESVFRKYGTFAQSAKNVGLGLAFCKMVAEKHSARLELLDSPGSGATFALVIPISSEPLAESDLEPRESDDAPLFTSE